MPVHAVYCYLLSDNSILTVQPRGEGWIKRIAEPLGIILAGCSTGITQAIRKCRAILRAGDNQTDQRGVVAIVGRVDGRQTVVAKPIPGPNHIVALSADVPSQTEPGREVQVI